MTQILVDEDIATVSSILSFVAQGNRDALHELNVQIRQEELFWKSLRIYEVEFASPPEAFFSRWHMQYLVEHRMLALEGPMWAANGESLVFLYLLKMFQGVSGDEFKWLIQDHRIP